MEFATGRLSTFMNSILHPVPPVAVTEPKSQTRDDLVRMFFVEYQRLDADQNALFDELKSLPFGMLNVLGVPGAGKTHVLLFILIMACNEEIDHMNRCFKHCTKRRMRRTVLDSPAATALVSRA
ncbi:uncharacterized protein PG986_002379 [Apiospora aurea]|uniref:DNA2/NAM7 helicase helicase domain-containing protein n=1 Tax=Apiospora aurea TaxID=335848 RepID=A0ABR1R062_9PEZI